MKFKNLLTFSLLVFAFSFTTVNAQQVEREMVVFEEGTATWCGYCPYAANAIHQLLEEGADIAAIAYHSGDAYSTPEGNSRMSYYNISGIPDARFDGVITVGGGYSGTYGEYSTAYNQRKNILSSYSITTTGSNAGFVHFEIETDLTKVAESDASNIKMHAVLVESHIAESWGGLSELNHVERLMIPDQYGTDVDFTDNEAITVNFGFDLEESWNYENCEILIFLQDNTTKEILQGKKIALSTIPGDNALDASIANINNVPLTNCSGNMAPVATIQNYGLETLTALDINYSINGTEHSYSWTGSLATMATEDVTLPEVTFETLENNTVEIELLSPNGGDDAYTGNNTASTTFIDAENSTTELTLLLRSDEHPEEITWELINSNGDITHSGGPYEEPNTFVEYQTIININSGECYSFIIHDAGNDGFSSTGIYQLKDSEDLVLAENQGDYGNREETQFFTISSTNIDDITSVSSVNIFPNPAKDQATLNINLAETANVAVTVFDVYGRRMSEYNQGELSTGNHSVMLNTSNFNSGLFFIKININGNELLQRLIVE